MPGCAELRHVCHARCRQMVEPVCLQPLVQVTRHSHNPAENEAKRRRRWLHADLARQLAICHASQKPALSLDVWYCIAGQLLQPYALAKARGALPDPSGIAVGAVTTARQMWYGFTEYEGVRYVSWLSNSPRERRSLRLTFEADRAPERLLVAENNLGVKKLSLADFCRSDCVADEEPGTRWRAIRLDPAGTSMDVETDVGAASARGRVLAHLPSGCQAPSIGVRPEGKSHGMSRSRTCRGFILLLRLVRRPSRLVWPRFQCNLPKATAYSFFWGCGLLHVHTHMTDEDPTFQPPFPYYSLLYMPLDQDEFITEIWQRKANFARERAVGVSRQAQTRGPATLIMQETDGDEQGSHLRGGCLSQGAAEAVCPGRATQSKG